MPAGLPGVITVAAADITHDATKAFPWSWSNYGQCVDIWAPGVEIESASPDCFECTAIYSGTSQATPLVSGLIASHLSANAADDPEAVKKALQENAAVNVLEVLGHPYDTTVNFFAQVTPLPASRARAQDCAERAQRSAVFFSYFGYTGSTPRMMV